MKNIRVVAILAGLFIICSIGVAKFEYNKLGNKPISELDKGTKTDLEQDDTEEENDIVNVPDESSKVDRNENCIPDCIDIVNEARKEAEQKTEYKDAYYAGGYPPEGEGVCTDVIWRGFKAINVSIKDLIDNDIKNNISAYKAVNGNPDPNIDFRRVLNQETFFKRHCTELTTDLIEGDVDNLKEWQPGDIVVFINSYQHVGIISDKRDDDGIPFVIHNIHPNASEAKLSWFPKIIDGHYRWKY